MRIIKQAANLLRADYASQYEVIERVGRTCYKSEDKITPGSSDIFVRSLVKSGHHAMLEFGFVYIKITDPEFLDWFDANKPDRIHLCHEYAVGNMRAFYDWFERFFNGEWSHEPQRIRAKFLAMIHHLCVSYPAIYEDQFYRNVLYLDFLSDTQRIELLQNHKMCPIHSFERESFYNDFNSIGHDESELFIITPHIVLFTTNRGVTHELCRHRDCSFAMESTRYCNYSKGKFGSEITVIEPMFEPNSDKYTVWYAGCLRDEEDYFTLLNLGATPQEARGKLPIDLKADLWVCAFEDEWQHIIDLRYHGITGAPHPQVKELIGLIYPALQSESNGRIM